MAGSGRPPSGPASASPTAPTRAAATTATSCSGSSPAATPAVDRTGRDVAVRDPELQAQLVDDRIDRFDQQRIGEPWRLEGPERERLDERGDARPNCPRRAPPRRAPRRPRVGTPCGTPRRRVRPCRSRGCRPFRTRFPRRARPQRSNTPHSRAGQAGGWLPRRSAPAARRAGPAPARCDGMPRQELNHGFTAWDNRAKVCRRVGRRDQSDLGGRAGRSRSTAGRTHLRRPVRQVLQLP